MKYQSFTDNDSSASPVKGNNNELEPDANAWVGVQPRQVLWRRDRSTEPELVFS